MLPLRLPFRARPQRCRRLRDGLATSLKSTFSPDSKILAEGCGQQSTALNSCYSLAGCEKRVSSSPALPGSLSLPRRTRAFLAPRPFQRRSSYHRRHVQIPPPFTAVPAGNWGACAGPPRCIRPASRIRNYNSQKPKQRTQENYSSQESLKRAHSLVSLLLGAESGRAEFGFSPRLGLVSASAL